MKFQVQIDDDSGTLDATVENRYAETLLGLSIEELYTKYQKEEELSIDLINEKIKQEVFLCEMRSYLPSHRHVAPLYYLTAFIKMNASEHLAIQSPSQQQSSQPLSSPPSTAIEQSEQITTSGDTPMSDYIKIALPPSKRTGTTSSAKRSLEQEFSAESKHPKFT